MNLKRIHSTANTDFFKRFVLRYPDKQYQTWLGGHHIQLGIDHDYNDDLRTKVAAAVVSHFGDFSFSSALNILRVCPERLCRIA
jgi:hypothetical protein